MLKLVVHLQFYPFFTDQNRFVSTISSVSQNRGSASKAATADYDLFGKRERERVKFESVDEREDHWVFDLGFISFEFESAGLS